LLGSAAQRGSRQPPGPFAGLAAATRPARAAPSAPGRTGFGPEAACYPDDEPDAAAGHCAVRLRGPPPLLPRRPRPRPRQEMRSISPPARPPALLPARRRPAGRPAARPPARPPFPLARTASDEGGGAQAGAPRRRFGALGGFSARGGAPSIRRRRIPLHAPSPPWRDAHRRDSEPGRAGRAPGGRAAPATSHPPPPAPASPLRLCGSHASLAQRRLPVRAAGRPRAGPRARPRAWPGLVLLSLSLSLSLALSLCVSIKFREATACARPSALGFMFCSLHHSAQFSPHHDAGPFSSPLTVLQSESVDSW
jgi:hypothetical protein